MFIKKLNEICDNKEIKASAKSINQTQRNQLSLELTKALLETLGQNCKEDNGIYELSRYINFGMIDNKTIEFAIDNARVGIIPVRVSIAFPNFDNDIDLYSRVEEYQSILEEKEFKAQAQAELKAKKIKADEERRAKAKAESESK